MPTTTRRPPPRTKLATATGGGRYWTAAGRPDAAALRDYLRTAPPDSFRWKRADVGGEQETGFEQAFSSLAWSYLVDKAPRLMDYVLGFQLIDRDEDNTKAVGVFGFKIGKQLLYAPVFFLNGDLKGHELLYVKNQDAFVPMKENWVNYLLSRKPHLLGEGSRQDAYQRGGLTPNVERLSYPPHYGGKYAADKQANPVMGGGAPGNPMGLTPDQAPAAMAGMSMPAFGIPAGAAPGMMPGMDAGGTGVAAQPSAPPPPTTTPPVDLQPPMPGADASAVMPGGGAGVGVGGGGAVPGGTTGDMPGMAGSGMISTAADRAALAKFDDWAVPFLPVFAAARVKSARFAFRDPARPAGQKLALDKLASAPFKAACLGVPSFEALLSEDWRLAAKAHQLAQQFPGFKLAMDRFYGPDLLARVARRHKAAADRVNLLDPPLPARRLIAANKAAGWSLLGPISAPAQKRAAGDGKVRIVTKDDVATTSNLPALKPDDLTDDDKAKVLRHGYLVKDERTGDEVTKVYNTAVRQDLTNPVDSGLYEVLEKPGKLSRMLVLAAPWANDGRQNFCVVVRVGADGGGRAWLNIHRGHLWADGRKPALREEYLKWWNGLGDKTDLSDGSTYVAVGHYGQATAPFDVQKDYGDGRYRVNFHTFADRGRPSNLPRTVLDGPPPGGRGRNHYDGGDYVSTYGAVLLVNRRRDCNLRAVGGELHVPEDDFKFLKLKGPPEPDFGGSLLVSTKAKKWTAADEPGDGSVDRPIDPGRLEDLQELFSQKTARLKLQADAHEVTVFAEKLAHPVRLRLGVPAVAHLIRVHGMRQKEAEAVLAEAARLAALPERRAAAYRLKYADDYPLQQSAPTSPPFPAPVYGTEPRGYNSVQSIYPQEEAIPVPGLDAGRTNPSVYDPFMNNEPDYQAMQFAQEAGRSGQKEVFDTAAIGGMLKHVRPDDTMMDKYLPPLMKALDSLGRMLFIAYWHNDDMAERYGKAEMPELLDSLRNTFESTGDVVLALKSKAVDSRMDDQMRVDLNDSGGN